MLALLEDENEEDEREDALGLRTEAAVPAAPAPETGAAAKPVEDGGKETAPAAVWGEGASGEAGALSRGTDARARPAEEWAEALGAGGMAEADVIGGAAAGYGAAGVWRDGPAVPVTRAGESAALGMLGPGDAAAAGPAGAERQAGADAAMDSMTAEKGLEGLYRQTVQAVRPAARNWQVEQQGRTARAGEPGRTAALTVDELDRAVRRDSRRYDGGMTLF